MSQLQRTLLAFGAVAMIGGAYTAQTANGDRSFNIGLWILGAISLALALILIWRDPAISKRTSWLVVAGAELVFTGLLIIDALTIHRLNP